MAAGYVYEALEMPQTSCFACWHAHSNELASSLNRIKPRSPGLFSILSLMVWQNSLLYLYWYQFVFGQFVLCIETTLSHCEWFFAQSFLKCRLPETVVMSTFMVIAQDTSLLSEHEHVFLQKHTVHRDLYCHFLHFQCSKISRQSLLSSFCMESFSLEIPCEILSGLGPLILLKSNFPEFSTFRALKIGLQHPS